MKPTPMNMVAMLTQTGEVLVREVADFVVGEPWAMVEGNVCVLYMNFCTNTMLTSLWILMICAVLVKLFLSSIVITVVGNVLQ